jgi:single-strand DNA-binding protein
MAVAEDLNRVVLTGNLTADPELRDLPSGDPVCNLRIASTSVRKDKGSGERVGTPNYFTVVVWGKPGENAAQYLSKGRQVAVDGRLQWREWETDSGVQREVVEIIADSVKYLGTPPSATS